jgi:hypothetical protein
LYHFIQKCFQFFLCAGKLDFEKLCAVKEAVDVIVQREVIAGGFAMLSVKMAKRNSKQEAFIEE